MCKFLKWPPEGIFHQGFSYNIDVIASSIYVWSFNLKLNGFKLHQTTQWDLPNLTVFACFGLVSQVLWRAFPKKAVNMFSYTLNIHRQFSEERKWDCSVCWVYRDALSVRKMRKTVIFAIFKDISSIYSHYRGHLQYFFWCNIGKQYMKYICLNFGASAV